MTLHPDAGRNDHIHGDENLSEFEEFNVTDKGDLCLVK